MLDFGTSLYIEYLVATGYLPPHDLEGSPTLIISPSTPAKNDFNVPIFLFLDSWQADVTKASSIRRAARSLPGYSTRPGHGNIDFRRFLFLFFFFFSNRPLDTQSWPTSGIFFCTWINQSRDPGRGWERGCWSIWPLLSLLGRLRPFPNSAN